MNEPLVTFDKVTKIFEQDGKRVTALAETSFSVQEGEIVAILGESGSGKSTIAKLLMGLHTPTSGRILLHGTDVATYTGSAKREVYRHLQMVFQDAVGSFNPRRRIGDSLRETLRLLGGKEAAKVDVGSLLQEVGLPPTLADAYPHELSGGQCQRAAIARAMSVHPCVLVCDEATSALDVSAQARILELLVQMHQKYGTTLLFITHDVALASAFATRLLVMYRGQLVEEGETQAVLSNPQADHTKELLAAVLDVDTVGQLPHR